MTDQREKPDFVVDPSGNVRDTRHMRYAFSQGPPSGSPGDSTDGQPSSPSPKKSKRTTYLIPIPIGLVIFLLISLFRHFILPDADVNTFDSESAYDAFRSGNYDFFRGEYDKAIVHYNMALLSESDVGDVYNGRGLAYQAKGDHDRALADFDRALELMPESAMVYNNRALSHHATGDYDQAIADLDKAIVLQANFGKAYYNRGLTYHAMGDYDRAIADLSQAFELSSDWSSDWPALPTDQGSDPGRELSVGFDNQMRAIQIRADLPSVYHNRGLAYLAKSEYDSAISDLDRAISLQPDLSAAYYARGVAYLAEGNYDKAKADCQTMRERGDDPEVQHLAEEVQILCDLVTLGYDVSFPTNVTGSSTLRAVEGRATASPWWTQTPAVPPTPMRSARGTARPTTTPGALPTKTARDAPAEEPPVPIAIYVPQAHETPTTPIWESSLISCDEKPLYMWSSPGRYLYKGVTDSGGSYFVTVEQKSKKENPSEDQCSMPWPNFGDRLTEPPETGFKVGGYYDGCHYDPSRPPGGISITVVGFEKERIGLGIYQAVRVDTFQEYYFPQSINYPQGSLTTSEWYVCGYGLIRSNTSHTGKYQGRNFESEYGLELISFAPISTNESHVRYIVADNQLSNLVEYYRANTTDEETAEALRRWNAGIRVVNIEEFERKIVDGQWQIVYAGTDTPVIGTDIILTSDSPQ